MEQAPSAFRLTRMFATALVAVGAFAAGGVVGRMLFEPSAVPIHGIEAAWWARGDIPNYPFSDDVLERMNNKKICEEQFGAVHHKDPNYLTEDEFKAVWQTICKTFRQNDPTDETVKEKFNKLDFDQNGKLDIKEFTLGSSRVRFCPTAHELGTGRHICAASPAPCRTSPSSRSAPLWTRQTTSGQ